MTYISRHSGLISAAYAHRMNKFPTFSKAPLSDKFHPPKSTPAQVARVSIGDAISNAQACKLVLFCAPAGFGKTSTMMQCRTRFEAGGIDTAWLTIDASDNDPYRFLSCLATAVAGMTEEPPASTQTNPLTMGFALGDTTLNIISRLAAHSAPFALFLDDFEQIREPSVLGLVREIIDQLPRRGQLVIGSRGVPDIGIGRLRARGQLVEIDTALLRFTLAETREFFTHCRGLAISPDHLNQLQDKTEGWIAALSLASLSLGAKGAGAQFIQRFSSSQHAVTDYLAEDVLAQQPEAIRAFLLRTSILSELNAALCDAILPGMNAAAKLAQLEAANLFITPLEGREKTYRYHKLFAGFLREQLNHIAPEEVPRLHQAAWAWYQTQDRPLEAIEHALEGGLFELALSLLDQHVETFLDQGHKHFLAHCFAAVPETTLNSYPMLAVTRVWTYCHTNGPCEAMAMLERSGCLNNADPDVQAHVLALRPVLLAMMDRYDEAYTEGIKNLARLPTSQPFADGILTNAMAYILAVIGKHNESQSLLDRARRNQPPEDGEVNLMYTELIEGVNDLIEGRLRQATARFRIAVNSDASNSSNYANILAGVSYACSAYETNNVDLADHLLNIYVQLAKDVVMPDHMITNSIMLSRIAFLRGDVDRGFQLLTELEYIGHYRQTPRITTSAKLERSRVFLLQNHPAAAKRELERANGMVLSEGLQNMRLYSNDLDYAALTEIRWEIMFGDSKLALAQLETETINALAQSRHRRVLKLRFLESIARQKNGDQRGAMRVLGDALRTACAEGFMRLILDEGHALGNLIRQFNVSNSHNDLELSNPIFAEYMQRLTEAFGPPPLSELDAHKARAKANSIDPLTHKEIRVLLLLAEGYSNNAIAERLFISDSTVRTHLRNINAKLNAQSRTQAVAIARNLGLIH